LAIKSEGQHSWRPRRVSYREGYTSSIAGKNLKVAFLVVVSNITYMTVSSGAMSTPRGEDTENRRPSSLFPVISHPEITTK